MIGKPVRRVEDPRLLRGNGMYLDDIELPNTLHVAFVRSICPHAVINGIDAQRALALTDVAAVYTGADLAKHVRALPVLGVPRPALERAINPTIKRARRYALAIDRVLFVGEPVAAVLATTRAAAEDGAERVEVDYDSLPAVPDLETAMAAGGTLLHPEFGDNTHACFTVRKGDYATARAEAAVVLRRRLRIQRQTGMPIECRGALADYDRREGMLTLWSSTQVPHLVKGVLVEALGLEPDRIRVVAPDVGGGFGTKTSAYPEEVAVAFMAMNSGRPVKWVEDRWENLVSATHGREQLHDVEVAASADGRILGIQDQFWMDTGAYNPLDLSMTYNTAVHMTGTYHIPHLDLYGANVATNKAPAAPFRGAGRPQGVFVMERLIDLVARALDMDPIDVRRRNLIPTESMPYDTGLLYKDGVGMVYDSGDYPRCFETALELVDFAHFRQLQADLRRQGRYVGIGMANYVEGTGIGPFEGATVRIDSSGLITVIPGGPSQGQGHQTTLAQVVAEVFGQDMSRIRVTGVDTAQLQYSLGTYHSRGAVVGGSAVLLAAQSVREKALQAAGELLEADPADLELKDGAVRVLGAPQRTVSLGSLSRALEPGRQRPGNAAPGLSETVYYEPETVTYANGVHATIVEVVPGRGQVQIRQYVVVHDCGVVLNPLIVDGQVHGGVAQGIGSALFEEIHYSADGQILTASLADYMIPTACEVPPIQVAHVVSPSPRNPLGVKGAGEGGAIGPPAAIASAIEDALAPFGVEILETPVTPERIWSMTILGLQS